MKRNYKPVTEYGPAVPVGGKIAKGAIAAANFLVDCIIILIFIVLIGFGVYSIWDTNQIYTASSSTLYETYKPAADNTDSPSFQDLVAINPDVLGWITIYGTGVDYPVVQGENNDEYMNTTADGKFALGGAIFLDFSNAKDFSDFNTVIYGHHMEKSEMFGDIDRFDDERFFNAHQYGNLYYGNKNHGLEFFAMVDADAYDFTLYNPHVDNAASYLDYIKSNARYFRSGVADPSDHIVMLSTCADTATNGRYVLFGKISDNTFEDSFVTTPTVITRTLLGNSGSEGGVPMFWLVIAVVLVLVLLAAVLTAGHYTKRRRRQ